MYILKTVLLGDSFTGKTSISESLIDNTFNENQPNTIGVSFYFKEFKILGRKIKLQIWDTSGLDRFIPITKVYIQDSQLILLIYDISKRESYKNVKKWFQLIQENVSDDNIFILIGNKNDKENRQVSFLEGEELAKELNNSIFFETSAVSNDKINELFKKILSKVISKKEFNKLNYRIESEDESSQEFENCCTIL